MLKVCNSPGWFPQRTVHWCLSIPLRLKVGSNDHQQANWLPIVGWAVTRETRGVGVQKPVIPIVCWLGSFESLLPVYLLRKKPEHGDIMISTRQEEFHKYKGLNYVTTCQLWFLNLMGKNTRYLVHGPACSCVGCLITSWKGGPRTSSFNFSKNGEYLATKRAGLFPFTLIRDVLWFCDL